MRVTVTMSADNKPVATMWRVTTEGPAGRPDWPVWPEAVAAKPVWHPTESPPMMQRPETWRWTACTGERVAGTADLLRCIAEAGDATCPVHTDPPVVVEVVVDDAPG
jgi:hypothetical protein